VTGPDDQDLVLATARAQRWEPPRCSASCSPRKSPAATPPPGGCAARPPRSPPGRRFSSMAQRGVLHPEATQSALITLEWIGRAENLVIAGPAPARATSPRPSPTPRSRRTCASPGSTLETLTAAIAGAKADGSVARTVDRICRSDLVVVDDIGMLPRRAGRHRRPAPPPRPHLVLTKGDSHRLAEALAGKGASPLAT